MKFLIAASVALLSGCASEVISSNPRSVTIYSVSGDVGRSQQAADAECAKYKGFARLSGRVDPYHFAYDCIK